ncbi:MAG: dihydropteridine reductase [Alkalibacterium sp.]|nr:dihydropteridine reductase [Alkalibacterium sp.]
MHIHWTPVKEIIEEAPNTFTYLLDCPDDFTWDEGAHTHMALNGFNSGEKPDKRLVRHMSISTLPEEDSIGITTRIKEKPSEFKVQLKKLSVGDSVALFKTHSNSRLKRENRPIYLLSCGVGIATFRPLILKYLSDPSGIKSIHSLSVDSSRNYLFADLFQSLPDQKLSSQFVDSRSAYYEELSRLANDKHALFYVVGGDDFLKENISCLRHHGIPVNQITLDKHEMRLNEFLSED